MNTGWTEWQEAGLPVHEDRELKRGEVHCSCSMDAGVAEAAPAPH